LAIIAKSSRVTSDQNSVAIYLVMILILPKSNHFCPNLASILPEFRLNFAQI